MCKLSWRAAVSGARSATAPRGAFAAAVLVMGLALACPGAKALVAPKAATPAAAAKAKRLAARALPCPKAGWKDDPVCFGANDPYALPVPSAQSGAAVKSDPRHAQDVAIAPKAGVAGSERPQLYGVDPQPHYNARELSGGIGVGVPF